MRTMPFDPSAVQRLGDGREIHVMACNVQAVGLRDFVVKITKQLELKMGPQVDFNMNSNAILSRWVDVFKAEKVYTTVLGIARRDYRCSSFTHEPARRLCYLILEELNHRSFTWLPAFTFKAMVICRYDEQRAVTSVRVEYDQLGFYMNCIGLVAAYEWFTRVVTTPAACAWARAYLSTGLVGPVTFSLQLLLGAWLLSRLLWACLGLAFVCVPAST